MGERAEVEIDPAGPPGDLAAEIAGFTTLRACVDRHRFSDPLMADGVDALGYDGYLFDLCRGVEAMKLRDRAPCDRALSARLRGWCQANVAMLTGDETLCPLDVRMLGVPEHEVVCLAAARRDVRPCALLGGGEGRAACEGLVARDPSRCGTSDRCLRRVNRWKSVLPPPAGKSPYPSRVQLEVTLSDEQGRPRAATFDLPVEAAAGVSLFRKKGVLRLVLGVPLPFSTTRDMGGGVYMEIPDSTRPEVRLPGSAARVVVRYPDGLMHEIATGTTVKVTIEQLGEQPNEPAKFIVEAVVGPASGARRVVWTVDTWVRDIVVDRPGEALDPMSVP